MTFIINTKTIEELNDARLGLLKESELDCKWNHIPPDPAFSPESSLCVDFFTFDTDHNKSLSLTELQEAYARNPFSLDGLLASVNKKRSDNLELNCGNPQPTNNSDFNNIFLSLTTEVFTNYQTGVGHNYCIPTR